MKEVYFKRNEIKYLIPIFVDKGIEHYRYLYTIDDKNYVINLFKDDDINIIKRKVYKLEKLNEECKEMFSAMQEAIPEVSKVCFTNRLKDHPVCLTTEGAISVEMQKVINALPNNQTIQAKTLLEINENHPIAQKLKELFNSDKEELKKYTKILYAQAKLIEGLNIDNPTEISNLICEMIAK